MSLVAAIVFILLYILITKKLTFPFIYCIPSGRFFSIGTVVTNSPLDIDKKKVVKINSDKFAVYPRLRFLADPFIVEENNEYYIFFEKISYKLFSKGADIAVLKSSNLKDWNYLGVALREPYHLSYPNVFKHKGKWYMIPGSNILDEIRIYESDNFPFNWKFKTTLINYRIVDATLIINGDDFYIYGQAVEDRSLRVFHSDDLFLGWKEHPSSPIRFGMNETQPAGNAMLVNDKMIYFVQDHSEGYGTAVIGYEIEILTKNEFKDCRLDEPILSKFGDGWASKGMHHITSVKMKDGSLFCVVDGVDKEHHKKWNLSLFNLPVFTDHL